MPKYEDFKVGDVWICRDGTEAVIKSVDIDKHYPIMAIGKSGYAFIFTANGFWNRTERPHNWDLLRPKTLPLDLTKPLRFKGETDGGFMLHELENVPEPVTLKQWAVVHKNTGLFEGLYSTENGAERNCHSDQVVVKLTGTYRV